MKYLLTFVMLALIMTSGLAYSSQPPLQNKDTKQDKVSDQYQQITNDEKHPLVVTALKAPISAEDTEKKAKEHCRKNIIEFGTLFIAIATAIVLILQWRVFRRQANLMRITIDEMKVATKASEKAAEASKKYSDMLPEVERAYLIGGGPVVNDEKATSMLTIHNVGRTPGFITKIEWGLCEKDNFLFDVPVSQIIDEKRLPGIETIIEDNVWPPSPTPVGMRHAVIVWHSEKVGHIFFGRISFKDIFGTSHYSTFKLQLTKDGSRTLPRSYSDDWK